jgi:hypothetical protein
MARLILLRVEMKISTKLAKSRKTDEYLPNAGDHAHLKDVFAPAVRRYDGADIQGLVSTKNWCDPKSAARRTYTSSRGGIA